MKIFSSQLFWNTTGTIHFKQKQAETSDQQDCALCKISTQQEINNGKKKVF